MKKGCIYYTHHNIDSHILSICQKQILESFDGEIISVSLKPLNFGNNLVLDLQPGVITMFKQILTGIENSTCDILFHLEHDVLYHESHFNFFPIREDVYYYNTNVWRWKYPIDYFITYDYLISLSGICAHRELLLNHYTKRMEIIKERGFEEGRDPNWARKMGYEPGKKRRRGGFLDEKTDMWKSAYPNIDIRHNRTITPPKVTLTSFKHKPDNWKVSTFDEIRGWDLKRMFNL